MSNPSEKAIAFSPKPWRYQINYGPDGEEDYANVYDQLGMFVGNYKLHQAIHIVQSANTAEALTEHMRVIEMAEKALIPYAQLGGPFLDGSKANPAALEVLAEIAKLRKE
jgi:hypothetical protein